jgi:chromosome segregation ATPase
MTLEDHNTSQLYLSNEEKESKEIFSNLLGDIKSELKVLAEKQEHKVSPEFSALMDGYVIKANESETLRVKYQHVESHYEELKLELKTQKAQNRQLGSDLDSVREALKLSELELSKFKRDFDHTRQDFQDKSDALQNEKEALLRKIKELMTWKETTEQLCNEMKAELVEYNHKVKQLQQENSIEKQTAERSLREGQKVIQELKEQLELREREASYKNALIEQLVRQTAQANGHSSINDINSVLKGMNTTSSANSNPEGTYGENHDDEETAKKFKWGAFRL